MSPSSHSTALVAPTALITPTTVVAVVATVIVLRSTWRSTPDWIKPAFLRRGRKEGDAEQTKDANDDIASPATIVWKLKEMMDIVGNECDEVTPDDLPWYKLNAYFLTLVHMSAEIRKVHPEYRDTKFESGGRRLREEELRELPELLDYSDWAYNDDYPLLRDRLAKQTYTLLRQDMATEPGRVGHFLAVSPERKTVLIALKGTSSIGDLLTDLLGKAVEHKLDSPFDDGYGLKPIRCHEGIFTAAKMMADDLQDLIEHLFLPAGYRLLICGHSLGAGTSCLLGMLLRSRIPELRKKEDKLRVMAFATPPVLNHDAAVACSSFATSVVNDTDVIPRASVGNVLIMNKLMLRVGEKLDEKGMGLTSLAGDLMKYDGETLMTPDDLDQFFAETHTKEDLEDEDNLYVPGQVIALYQKCNRGDEDAEKTCFGAVVADGGLSRLREIEPRMEMLTDHFCDSYKIAIDTMCKQVLA